MVETPGPSKDKTTRKVPYASALKGQEEKLGMLGDSNPAGFLPWVLRSWPSHLPSG